MAKKETDPNQLATGHCCDDELCESVHLVEIVSKQAARKLQQAIIAMPVQDVPMARTARTLQALLMAMEKACCDFLCDVEEAKPEE